jgi:hypothetical protein
MSFSKLFPRLQEISRNFRKTAAAPLWPEHQSGLSMMRLHITINPDCQGKIADI